MGSRVGVVLPHDYAGVRESPYTRWLRGRGGADAVGAKRTLRGGLMGSKTEKMLGSGGSVQAAAGRRTLDHYLRSFG